MNRKMLWTIVIIMVAAISLAGCGGTTPKTPDAGKTNVKPPENDNNAEGKKPDDDKQVTLRMTYWAGSQTTTDKTNKVIELFQEKYPNIKIESEFTGWNGYYEKLNVQAAGNSLPDLVRHDYSYIAQFAGKDLLLDLSERIASGQINLKDVDEAYLSGGMIDGKMYGVNIANNALSVIYDPEAFEKAGVPAPTPNWTWEEYEQHMLQIKNNLGIYGDKHQELAFPLYLRQHGASLYNKEGTALGYTDDQLFIDFYEMQLRLQKQGAISTIAEELEAKGIEDTPFGSGKAAMVIAWSNNLPTYEDVLKKPLTLALPPGSGEGKGMYVKPSQFMTISKSSKHPEEAAKFIDFWINDIEANKVLNGFGGMPVSANIMQAMEPDFDEAQKKMTAYIAEAAKYSSQIDPADPSGAGEVSKLLSNIGQEIFFEKISAQDGAEKFRRQANEILGKNK